MIIKKIITMACICLSVADAAEYKFDKQLNTEKASCTKKKFAAAPAQAPHNSPVCRKLDHGEAEGNS